MATDIRVGLLTQNIIVRGRHGLFERTHASLCAAFSDRLLTILDNGSTDGTAEIVGEYLDSEIYGPDPDDAYIPPDGVFTPGRGRNELIQRMTGRLNKSCMDPNTLCVLSDDDILWSPEAEDRLSRFWSAAPDDVAIVSGLLEPVWEWNTPREVIEAGGVKVLLRDSAPAAAWSFRVKHIPCIFPLTEGFGPGVLGEDVEACRRLTSNGLRVGQLELAEHLGAGVSSHGNRAHLLGRPLRKKEWGLE